MDETVAVFDETGAVVGSAPRSRVYREGLWHGSSGVLLRSVDGERIYVHRRTTTKAVFAGMHDCLAGGVMDPGESPVATARRELAEELGVTGCELVPIARAAWSGRSGERILRCHLYAFEARYDGPVHHQATEVSEGWWWTDAELATHLADPDWPFVPDTRELLATVLG
ncbi:NUDIX domain-containing protein [Actinomycetes bacterium M1A6_2h]